MQGSVSKPKEVVKDYPGGPHMCRSLKLANVYLRKMQRKHRIRDASMVMTSVNLDAALKSRVHDCLKEYVDTIR